MKPFRLILLAAFASGSAIVARGDALLLAASGSTLCEGNSSVPIQNPSACTVAGGVSGSVQEAPSVQLVSHAAVPQGGVSSQATNLKYFFEVIGGSAGDQVPLLIETSLEASAAGRESFAAADIQVGTTSQVPTVVAVCTDGTCPYGTGFSGTFSVEAVSGGIGSVLLVTQAAVGGLVGGTADALADPFIFVDPTFPGAGNYSILVSEGVGNNFSAAPEPASWLLLGTGLAAFGYTRRTKRRSNRR